MPHKKNPELSERVCGLARLVRGHSVTALENVALWHERDISHSSAERLILPDSCMALDYILDIFTGVMRGLRVYPERMWHNIEMTKGLVFSQRVLIALLESGLSRERSYEIVQASAMRSWDESADFRDLLRQEPEVTERLPGDVAGVHLRLQLLHEIRRGLVHEAGPRRLMEVHKLCRKTSSFNRICRTCCTAERCVTPTTSETAAC